MSGMKIEANTKLPVDSIVCDACELETPLERKYKNNRNILTDALARFHVDAFQISPEGFNSHKNGMILIDKVTFEHWDPHSVQKIQPFNILGSLLCMQKHNGANIER